MNIREWFGYAGNDEFITRTDKVLENLLTIYRNALEQYFSVSNTKTLTELTYLVMLKDLNREQELFYKWLVEKGIKLLSEISSNSIPETQDLIAKLNYEIYILNEEMDFEYPEDVVSSLIDIASLLPQVINSALEVSGAIEKSSINNWKVESVLVEDLDLYQVSETELVNFFHVDQSIQTWGNPNIEKNKLLVEKYFQVNHKGVYFDTSKEESASSADSFFM